MKCLSCDALNRETDKICRRCGRLLAKLVAAEEDGEFYNWKPLLMILITIFLVAIVLRCLSII